MSNFGPYRRALSSACVIVGCFLLAFTIVYRPSQGDQPARSIAQQRAEFTQLRPDLASQEYWDRRCKPYLDNYARIKTGPYQGAFDNEALLAKAAFSVCKQNQSIEDNGQPGIRDLYERGEINQASGSSQRKKKTIFTAVDAGL
jgi:hypothetical protein